MECGAKLSPYQRFRAIMMTSPPPSVASLKALRDFARKGHPGSGRCRRLISRC
jgi:hypothetical protein